MDFDKLKDQAEDFVQDRKEDIDEFLKKLDREGLSPEDIAQKAKLGVEEVKKRLGK